MSVTNEPLTEKILVINDLSLKVYFFGYAQMCDAIECTGTLPRHSTGLVFTHKAYSVSHSPEACADFFSFMPAPSLHFYLAAV